jgi:PAS domain-containing protein
VTDRLRSWIGFDELTPERFPFLAKLERAEEDVAMMRLAVVVLNGLAFLAFGVDGTGMSRIALAVLGLAFVYATATVVFPSRPAFGEMAWSLFTVGVDAVAIAAWLAATGGWASPYYPVMYASIAAVGYRFNLPITTAIGSAYVGAYAAVCLVAGGVGSWIGFGLRALYVPLIGAIVGLAAEGYVDMHHDHRDRTRRLVDAIETMDRRFAAVLEDVPDVIVLTDEDGRVEYANASVARIGLASPTDPQARGLHAAAIGSAIDERETVEYRTSLEASQATASFWCRAAPILDAGEPVGAVVTARRTPAWVDQDPAAQAGTRDLWEPSG